MYLCLCLSAILILSFSLGLGITYWLAPQERSQRFSILLFSSQIGFAVITLIGWYFYHLTPVSGTDVYARPVTAGLLGLTLLPLVFKRHRTHYFGQIRDAFRSKKTTLSLFGAAVATCMMAYPALQHSQLTPVSLFNLDAASYAASERHLKEEPRECKPSLICSLRGDYTENTVFGAYEQSAFVSSVLGLQTYQVFMPMILAYFFLLVFGSFYLCFDFFQFEAVPSALIAFSIGINPIPFYSIYQGFKAQLGGMALFVPLFTLSASALKAPHFRGSLGYLPLLVLLSWGLSMVYPHMLPICYFMMGLIWLLEGIQRKSIPWIGWTFLYGALLVGLVCLLSPYRAYIPISYMFAMKNAHAGWFMPALSLDRILGCFLHKPLINTLVTRHTTAILPSVLLAAWVISGLWQIFRKDRLAWSRSLGLIGFILLGYYYLAFTDQEEGEWGGYISYKWLAFFLPLLLPSLNLALRNWRSAPRILAPITCLIVSVSAFSTLRFLKQVAVSHRWVPPGLAQTQTLESLPDIQAINIIEDDNWNSMWIICFAGHKILHFQHAPAYVSSPLDAPWDLVKSSNTDYRLVKHSRVDLD